MSASPTTPAPQAKTKTKQEQIAHQEMMMYMTRGKLSFERDAIDLKIKNVDEQINQLRGQISGMGSTGNVTSAEDDKVT